MKEEIAAIIIGLLLGTFLFMVWIMTGSEFFNIIVIVIVFCLLLIVGLKITARYLPSFVRLGEERMVEE